MLCSLTILYNHLGYYPFPLWLKLRMTFVGGAIRCGIPGLVFTADRTEWIQGLVSLGRGRDRKTNSFF